MPKWMACKVLHANEKDVFPVLTGHKMDASLVDDAKLKVDDPRRFKEARDGDHLMVPFVCDECVFWDLMGRHFDLRQDLGDELMEMSLQWEFWIPFGPRNGQLWKGTVMKGNITCAQSREGVLRICADQEDPGI